MDRSDWISSFALAVSVAALIIGQVRHATTRDELEAQRDLLASEQIARANLELVNALEAAATPGDQDLGYVAWAVAFSALSDRAANGMISEARWRLILKDNCALFRFSSFGLRSDGQVRQDGLKAACEEAGL